MAEAWQTRSMWPCGLGGLASMRGGVASVIRVNAERRGLSGGASMRSVVALVAARQWSGVA